MTEQRIDFNTYQSPFTYRYSGPDMRQIWSPANYWRYARHIWVSVAETQQEAGIVTKPQVNDLRKHAKEISVERIYELENNPEYGTKHDVMAAIKEFSEKAPIGGVILQQGLTSEDILSNVEILQIHDSFDFVVLPKLENLLLSYAQKINKYKDLACMGYTHLQVAEPTTMGYRFAEWAQDLLSDLRFCEFVRNEVKAKGIKGPIGTQGSIENVLKNVEMNAMEHEQKVMEKLGIPYVTIASQTYPRKFLYLTTAALAGIAQSLHRSHFNLILLQSSMIDEVSEPRKKGQTGSSAMPHKQNPKDSENICSLTQELAGKLVSAWMTPAFVTLERTLRDSAGKRSFLPESFLTIDEALTRSEKVISGLNVHENSVKTNLEKFAPYSATEIILGDLVNLGMDRVKAHEILVELSEKAVDDVRSGKNNPLQSLVLTDERITKLLKDEQINQAFDEIKTHTGNAALLCDKFLNEELLLSIK